ncbi:MAG: hypothetical protein IT343_21135 [Candidatus Melainabacteria bacterium]|jgi:hypothetical protein|nr:hypothetical protein [Candidatus Melainabacteria bacterium]
MRVLSRILAVFFCFFIVSTTQVLAKDEYKLTGPTSTTKATGTTVDTEAACYRTADKTTYRTRCVEGQIQVVFENEHFYWVPEGIKATTSGTREVWAQYRTITSMVIDTTKPCKMKGEGAYKPLQYVVTPGETPAATGDRKALEEYAAAAQKLNEQKAEKEKNKKKDKDD